MIWAVTVHFYVSQSLDTNLYGKPEHRARLVSVFHHVHCLTRQELPQDSWHSVYLLHKQILFSKPSERVPGRARGV